jgi:hypothetical protein
MPDLYQQLPHPTGVVVVGGQNYSLFEPTKSNFVECAFLFLLDDFTLWQAIEIYYLSLDFSLRTKACLATRYQSP